MLSAIDADNFFLFPVEEQLMRFNLWASIKKQFFFADYFCIDLFWRFYTKIP